MLYQIVFSWLCVFASQFFLCMARKAANTEGTWCRRRTLAVIRFMVKYRMLPLTLNNHIVHDRTCIYDLPYLIFRPGKCKESDNRESSLKHAKCTLDILPARLLTLSKPRLLTSWHIACDCLHKCCPSWIDAIRRIVSFVVLMAIDHKVHRRIMAFN
jgi:hypothetical protein